MSTPAEASAHTDGPTDAHGAERARAYAFLSAFTRRKAARTVDFPGGFAALDDAYALSRGDNHLLVDGPTEPEELPDRAEELLGHLPHRAVYVIGDEVGRACAVPLLHAGYAPAVVLVMVHTGPVPERGGPARWTCRPCAGRSRRAGAGSCRRRGTR
ncbi:hypothetical protein [Streptomyces sp. CC208A]|uniref:hypothetical protein n=1 Tax=Streptomyces sp. CC208A TaxID=3044573 RepID=UPI0032C19E81